MTSSEIIWGKSRDVFQFHRCSCPEILEQLFRKIRENSQEKICVGVLFLILPTKTLYYGQFPGNFKYFRTAISRNFLKVIFPRKQSPKSCSEKFEKFLKKTSFGVYSFFFLVNKTTLQLIVSREFCKMFQISCFKERFWTSASENVWESCRSLNKNAGCSFSTSTEALLQ